MPSTTFLTQTRTLSACNFKKMANNCLLIKVVLCACFVVSLCLLFPHSTTALGDGGEEEEGGSVPLPVPARPGTVVKKDERWSVVTTEFGEISAVKVGDDKAGFYHLQFITMDPDSLFLPVHLHSDMVFYVASGGGTLSWADLENEDDKLQQVQLQTGDVYRLRTGTFFYLQSNLDSERRRLRIYAIFSDSKEELREGRSFKAYATVRDLVLGFDNKVLQAALNVEEEVIEELKSGEGSPLIVHGVPNVKESWEVHYRIMRAFLGRMNNGMLSVNKDKEKAYNILTAKHDVENCNGWSLVVTSEQLDALKDSDFGIFLVNLTKGAMMGPHWNPTTAEIAVVLSGRGMVHVVCPSIANETECKSSRFRVEEGDIFVVPRYHPMAQMSFNNGSFVFMGFTITTKKNHPQYLAGKASVFQTLDKLVLAASFGVSNTTMDQVLSAQREAIILECTSCAEDEERLMEEEIESEKEEVKKREEERKRREKEAAAARKKEEEEAKRKEEEEEAKREEEEEAKREEEEARRQKEEAARQEEEARKEEEEKARRQREEARQEKEARKEEEKAKREEEEAEREREEEEARRQKEEEARQEEEAREEEEKAKREEEEAARKREEEAARKREEEAAKQGEKTRREQEEAQKREEEEARRTEEEKRKKEEEEEAARRQEEEAARQEEEARTEEEEAKRREQEKRKKEEQEEARRQEEVARREQEKAHKREEEKRQQQEKEEAMRQQEEKAARQQEETKRRQEEEARRQEEETRRRQQEEEAHGGGGQGHQEQGEGAAARKEEEEMAGQQRETEAAARAREGQGGQGNRR